MPFTPEETTRHIAVLEEHFWSHRRPPLALREQIREGQRLEGQSIELFFVRPAFQRPGVHIEESIAKLRRVRSRGVWQIFWKRADGKWHRYPPHPETKSLISALQIIHEDAHACFFG